MEIEKITINIGALSQAEARIQQITQFQIINCLQILNGIAGINRFTEDEENYNFEKEVRMDAGVTLLKVNSVLQNILDDETRWTLPNREVTNHETAIQKKIRSIQVSQAEVELQEWKCKALEAKAKIKELGKNLKG
jgi:hypothetical protein